MTNTGTPTENCPKDQTVAQDGADHDEAEGDSPYCLGHLSLHISQSCVVYRREISPEFNIDERRVKVNQTNTFGHIETQVL